MRLFRRAAAHSTNDVRQGTGPTDNLVVLIVSLAMLIAIGAAFVVYFGFVR
jgi:hypothetical protein